MPVKLTEFKGKRILIVGYGKEGRATKEFLKKSVPDAKIGIADEKYDAAYLEKQNKYDFAIRTPGIRKELRN